MGVALASGWSVRGWVAAFSALAVLLTAWPVLPASAVEGSVDPADAPMLWCKDDGSTVTGGSVTTRHAVTWIPAGATVTFTAQDIKILPSKYVGSGRGEYRYYVKLAGVGTGGADWTKYNLANVGIVSGGGPYSWVSVPSKVIGSWKNATTVSKAVNFSTWAERTFAGAGTTYSIGVSVTGGTTGGEPMCQEEWVLDSLGTQPDGGETADPVNTGNGNFFDTAVDVPNVGALGDPLLERTYNAMDPGRLVDPVTGKKGVFGEGFTSWLDSSLTELGTDRLIYRDPTGRQVSITKDAGGDWVVPTNLRASVVDPAGGTGRRLVFAGGRSVQFDLDGRLVEAVSGGGGESVVVDRDATTHVPTGAVFRTHGEVRAELLFTDTGADGLIDQVEGPGGIQVDYSYDAQGRLKDVSVPHRAGDPAPAAVSYEWVGGRIKRILTQLGDGAPARLKVENSYDAQGRVTSQTQINGDVTTFTYAAPDATNRRRTTVTHTGSGSTETYVYIHDAVGTLLGVTDADGQSVGLAWQDKRLTSSVTRGGAQTSYAYDAQKRITSATLPSASTPGAAGPVEEVTYCDPAGDDLRARTITDAGGAVTRFTYGEGTDPDYPCAGQAARPTSITEGVGTPEIAVTRYEWAAGLPVTVTDPDGVVTRMRWDTARRLLLAKETDPDPDTPGVQVTFNAYDTAGRLRVTRTPGGVETWYDHDPAGRVTKVTGPFQAADRGCTARTDTCAFPAGPPSDVPVEEFGYRRDGQLTSYTDQTDRTWTYTEVLLAGGGRKETETGPDGHTRVIVFDSADRLITDTVGDEAAGEKAVTTYNYGAMGRLASVVDPTGVRTRFRYDADSNLTEVLDESDHATTTTYDRLGRPTSRTDAKGNTSTFEYNAIGLLTRMVDRVGAETTYTYDKLGRLLTTTDARGGVTTRTYTPAGRLKTLTDATDRATSYGYDDAGRLTRTTAPSDAITRYGYDADDQLTRVTTPAGRVSTYDYDAAGRPTAVTTPTTGATELGYNARGDLTSRTEATGGTITWTYDALGQVATVTDPLGAATAFEYDSRGNRTSRTDAHGKVTRWRYNKADQLTATVDPLARETTYTYDTLGRLATRHDPADRQEAYGYDALGQLTSISYPGQTAVPDTTFSYDKEGRRTKVAHATGTTDWTYDAVGNLVAEDNAGDRDLAWTWDLAGRRLRITYPDGTVRRNTYTPDGYLAAVQRLTDPGTDSTPATWASEAVNAYDADGLLTEQTQPGHRTRTWTLDPATGLTSRYQDVPTSGTGGGPTTSTDLSYDDAGRVTAETTTRGTDPAVTTGYDYDDAGQVLGVDRSTGTDETYVYDDLGRRTALTATDPAAGSSIETTYAYDDASQLTSRTVDGIAHAYAYDPSGRRTSESWTTTTGADAGANSVAWTWDVRGALTGEQHTSPAGVVDIQRRVRSDGRLAQIDVARTGQPTQTTQLVWDETDTASGQVPRVVWSGQRGTPGETTAAYGPDLIRTDCPAGTGCTGSIAHDARGSALATTDTAAIIRADAYGAYGNAASGNPGTPGIGFGYLDEIHVGSLIHLRARDYEPATGTFLSPDPLDGVDGTTTIANPYHYTNNDPLNLSDPTGLRPGETDCQGFLASVICEHQELFITTASITVGLACGMGGLALAGPFAGGAAGAACGGAVHRGLTAYTTGDNPWAAALNPQLLIRDALIGGVSELALFRVAAAFRPLAGKAANSTRAAIQRVLPRVGDTATRIRSALTPSARAAKPAIGFADDAVGSAYQGMRSGGGHAIRHLRDEGLIANSGSLASQVSQFEKLTSPILRSPSSTFDWRLGNTLTRGFAGEAGGQQVVVFVAKEGPYQGRVLSAVVPDANQMAQWGLP